MAPTDPEQVGPTTFQRLGPGTRGMTSDAGQAYDGEAPLCRVTETATPVTKAQARAHTEQMRKTATQMWEEAVVAYERKAWAALGYGSFAEYMREEFDTSKASAYRMLDAGYIVRELAPPPPPIESHGETGSASNDSWEEREKRRQMKEVVDEFGPVYLCRPRPR